MSTVGSIPLSYMHQVWHGEGIECAMIIFYCNTIFSTKYFQKLKRHSLYHQCRITDLHLLLGQRAPPTTLSTAVGLYIILGQG
jgi:hypothetical protein